MVLGEIGKKGGEEQETSYNLKGNSPVWGAIIERGSRLVLGPTKEKV